MVEFLDPAYYITAIAAISTATVGFIAIRNDVKKRQEESKKHLADTISNETGKVITHIDERLKVVDERFRLGDTAHTENKEDIEDVEDEVKQMTKDFRTICDKLTKHEYVIDNVLPEFKTLREEFYKFKTKVDHNLVIRNKGSDLGNMKNINEQGEIQD